MKLVAVAALLAGAAIAAPTSNTDGPVCPSGLYSNPQCCSTLLLGIIGIDCKSPGKTPRDGKDFGNICSETGDQALCCVVPVAGQALLCQTAVGA